MDTYKTLQSEKARTDVTWFQKVEEEHSEVEEASATMESAGLVTPADTGASAGPVEAGESPKVVSIELWQGRTFSAVVRWHKNFRLKNLLAALMSTHHHENKHLILTTTAQRNIRRKAFI